MDHQRSSTWLKIAVVYFAIGVTLGVIMGGSGDHRLSGAHAHINLLGWVSMALFAVITRLWPATAEGRLANVQFWVYNLALPVMLLSLGGKLLGMNALDPVLGVSSIVTGVAVLMFVFQVLTRAGR